MIKSNQFGGPYYTWNLEDYYVINYGSWALHLSGNWHTVNGWENSHRRLVTRLNKEL